VDNYVLVSQYLNAKCAISLHMNLIISREQVILVGQVI